MLHACIQKFDLTGTVGNFLRTKQGHVLILVIIEGKRRQQRFSGQALFSSQKIFYSTHHIECSDTYMEH